MPVFKEKQWILIIANFRAKFFDIMNPYYSGDSFLPTISAVIHNFKVLFAATYENSSSFSVRNFESRFVPAPKVNFRWFSMEISHFIRFKPATSNFLVLSPKKQIKSNLNSQYFPY